MVARAAALGLLGLVLLGSSAFMNSLVQDLMTRDLVQFTDFKLRLSPAQFYAKLMSKATIHDFVPFASPALEESPTGFGSGSVALPIGPIGYWIMYDMTWEYSGIVFYSTPSAFRYEACFTHTLSVSRADAADKCLLTLSESVGIESDPEDDDAIIIRRAAHAVRPRVPVAALVAAMLAWHLELHHRIVLPREWEERH